MPYVHADVVKTLWSNDRKAKVEFLKRNDGLYEYRGYVERVENGPYLSPLEYSGLYATAEEAEQAARSAVSWLQET